MRGSALHGLRRQAEAELARCGRSESRLEDVMHLLAARALGCRYILARDRFIWSNAKYYGLEYVN